MWTRQLEGLVTSWSEDRAVNLNGVKIVDPRGVVYRLNVRNGRLQLSCSEALLIEPVTSNAVTLRAHKP